MFQTRTVGFPATPPTNASSAASSIQSTRVADNGRKLAGPEDGFGGLNNLVRMPHSVSPRSLRRGIDMCADLVTVESDTPLDEVVTTLRRDGAVIVRELVSAQVMVELTSRLAPALAELSPGGGEFFGFKKKSVGGLFGRDPGFSEHLLLNERVLEIADATLLPEYPMASGTVRAGRAETIDAADYETYKKRRDQKPDPVLGPNCHHYQVNVGGALQVFSGGAHQPLHREMGIYRPYLQHDPKAPECILAVNWAGTDFTAENGATRLVPGSHEWDGGREAKEHEIAQAVMPKGSAVFWLGKTLHGLGASTSTQPRTGLLFTLVVNWLATEENQFLAVPPPVARQLPARAQQLLGYRSSPTLGWVAGLDQENMLTEGKGGPL